MDVLRQDVRAAIVAMRRAPGFTATALLTLALGVGATTAVFSIVNGVLLRPLPYASPDRLVRVWEEHPGGVSPAGNRWLSRSTFHAWRERSGTLEVLGGHALTEVQTAFGGEGVNLLGARVSAALMATLGVRPALGRSLIVADEQEGAAPVVMLSHALWSERYGASPTVVGGTLVIDGTPHTIAGVAAAAFEFPDARVRLWMPYAIPPSAAATGPTVFSALARLKPGVTIAQAEAEGTAAARAAPRHPLSEFFFGKGGPVVVHARALPEDVAAPARPALSVLTVAVTLVLLIACANVTNLLLSRGVARERELAIRAAVGASRVRIARQLFTECAVLSAAGGTLGLLLAWWLVRLLPSLAPAGFPRVDAVRLDGTVLAAWLLTTAFTVIAAALAPAVRGARIELADAVRSADRSADVGFRGVRARRLRDGLLVLEAAFAVILIVGAGLLARSFGRLVSVDNGYTAEGVLVSSIDLPRGATAARTDHFIESVLARLRALPGVSAAGASAMIPLMRRTAVTPFTVPEAISGAKATRGRALVYWITPGYAEAIGLRLREGRLFTETDARAGTQATIVNQEFARQHLAVRQPAGLTIPNLTQNGVTAEIVGVVGNVLKDGNDRQPQPELYFVHGAHGQRIEGRVNLAVRTTGDPAALAQDVRAVIGQIEREAVVDRIEPLTVAVAASLDGPRFSAALVSGFAAVAMMLAAIGLYGVLSYNVAQRVRELAVRSALGARRVDLVRLVLGQGLALSLAGIAVGMAGAAAFTRLMQDLLFGVTALDVVAFTAGPAALAGASLAACLGPAWRAARTDPATVLRG